MMQVFEEVVLPQAKRMLIPAVQFVLLYLLKVLFSNIGQRELVGSNAQQGEKG